MACVMRVAAMKATLSATWVRVRVRVSVRVRVRVSVRVDPSHVERDLAEKHGGPPLEERQQVARLGRLQQCAEPKQLALEQQPTVEEARTHLGDGQG